jgi:hypothetical protein
VPTAVRAAPTMTTSLGEVIESPWIRYAEGFKANKAQITLS